MNNVPYAANMPDAHPPSVQEHLRRTLRHLGTRQAWLGGDDADAGYGALFMPRVLPWSRTRKRKLRDLADGIVAEQVELHAAPAAGRHHCDKMAARRKADEASELPFYGLDDELPIVLAAICGFQHCLAMLAGIITPPIILASSLSLPSAIQSYLISASLISSGLLSAIQISGIPLPFIRRQLGTGLLSVVGTSFTTITTAMSIFKGLYTDGTCPSMTSADGTVTRGACPEAYGYLLGTAAVCSLLEIFLSFLPVRIMRRLFPPAVTGVTVMLIGASLIGESGVVNWGGGSSCHGRPTSGMYTVCPAVGGPHALPWGSPQYIGLGFLSFMTIVLVEIFGSPVMRNASIVIGLLLPLAVAGPTGYMSRASIDSAPAITFLWTTTFKLKVYGPGVLAMLAVYICLMMEAIGDITATSEVSRLPVDGESFNRRLQGGVLSDGLGGLLSALFTTTPQSVFAQNNGVISITRIANRRAGYWCCFWLILLGILGKFSGAILAIPNSVLGGVTTFLFASVVVSGLKIISTVKFTRRNRFILAASLSFGFGVLLVSDFFEYLFSYSGPNKALEGFLTSITIVLSTPFLISAVVSMVLNFLLPYDVEDLVEVARRKKADVERGHLGQEQAQEQVADVERDIESLEKSAEGVAAEKGA